MPVRMGMANASCDGCLVVVQVVVVVMGVRVFMLQVLMQMVMHMLLGQVQPEP